MCRPPKPAAINQCPDAAGAAKRGDLIQHAAPARHRREVARARHGVADELQVFRRMRLNGLDAYWHRGLYSIEGGGGSGLVGSPSPLGRMGRAWWDHAARW